MWLRHAEAAVNSGARPGPRFRGGDQLSADRIQFCIAQSDPKVMVVQRAGIEAALPGVPTGGMSCVPKGRIAFVRLLERKGKRIRLAGNHHQMHMVGHETVAQERQVMQEDILTQQVQIDGTLVIGSENELACIAPLRDMVRYIYDDDTGKSCHHKRKYQKTSRLSPSSRVRRNVFCSGFVSTNPES